jgi:hypothetical protein
MTKTVQQERHLCHAVSPVFFDSFSSLSVLHAMWRIAPRLDGGL